MVLSFCDYFLYIYTIVNIFQLVNQEVLISRKESHRGRQEGKEKSREVDNASLFFTKRAIYNCTR